MKLKQYLIFEEIRELLSELALDAAIEFAEDMHKGQVRKDSRPYVIHPKAVYSILRSFKVTDKVLLISAWLHDTIEDTSATFNIIKRKFNKETAELVKSVTSDSKEIVAIGKPKYLLNKMLNMTDAALTLKLADRLHNVTDISKMPKDKQENLRGQTEYILDGLREKRSLSKIQKKIIKAIEQYLR